MRHFESRSHLGCSDHSARKASNGLRRCPSMTAMTTATSSGTAMASASNDHATVTRRWRPRIVASCSHQRCPRSIPSGRAVASTRSNGRATTQRRRAFRSLACSPSAWSTTRRCACDRVVRDAATPRSAAAIGRGRAAAAAAAAARSRRGSRRQRRRRGRPVRWSRSARVRETMTPWPGSSRQDR